MSRLDTRLARLERIQVDRAHLLAEPYPAHTKEKIDFDAVFAVMEELFETAPMGKEAALDLVLRSIPKPLRTPRPTGDRDPSNRTATSAVDEKVTTA